MKKFPFEIPMSSKSNQHDPMEEKLQQALRGLPLRRAPRSLEQRVLAEIGRRAALPWWQKSYVHWPVAARAGFIVLCTGFAKLALMGGVWLMSGFDNAQFKTAFAEPYSWMERGFVIVNAITASSDLLLRNIPAVWIYGGVAVFAAMYATLFGLGAAAYKALSAQR